METNTNSAAFKDMLNRYKNKLKELKDVKEEISTVQSTKNMHMDVLRAYNKKESVKNEPAMCNNVNSPFLVSNELVVYSLNPYKSKRIYKKHRLSKSPLPYEIYTCEVLDNNFIVTLDNGIVLCGESVFEDLYSMIQGFDFSNIHSFFGLTERMVQAAFYVNHK